MALKNLGPPIGLSKVEKAKEEKKVGLVNQTRLARDIKLLLP